MREFKKITCKEEISKMICEFSDIFPHLLEKIESIDTYSEKLSLFANVCVGVEDSKVFGICVFYSNNKETKCAYISLIGVKSSFQGGGYGYWLLNRCEEFSINDGMEKMSLEVDLDNKNAISFYERNGFTLGEETNRNSAYMYKRLKGN